MIKFEHTEVHGFEHAIRGMRQPFKVTEKSDSGWCEAGIWANEQEYSLRTFVIGPDDAALCHKLNKAGSPHNKFLRQIVCWVDITAPRFWWQEADTYRLGVEKNSESTMHSIMKRPFMPEDFTTGIWPRTIDDMNYVRDRYLRAEDLRAKKDIWRELIDNLPQSYLQKRTTMMSYQAIRSICEQRKGHKLSEWTEFIDWARRLPNAWLLFDDLYIEPEDPDDNEPWETKAAIAAGR